MKYESEFRIKEKEFRPRENYSHQQVVDELANIVKRADLEIEELSFALKNEVETNFELQQNFEEEAHDSLTFKVLTVLSVVLNGIFIHLL